VIAETTIANLLNSTSSCYLTLAAVRCVRRTERQTERITVIILHFS